MSGQDQAAGLRKWADLQRQQQQAEEPVDVAPAEHVPEQHVSELHTPTPEAASKPAAETQPKPKIPLVVVGLPGSGVSNVNKVKARLEQWSTLGRRWAGEPGDWEVRIVMADSTNLSQLRNEYSRWALWINSDADAFAPMYRTLCQLRENGGPSRLLALHEPHLPRQGLLDNLREAAEYYLKMELLVLAR